MATKRKYSIFCKTKPGRGSIGPGAVYLSSEQIWVLAKGKRYLNGHFRYIYNGREGNVDPYHWVNLVGLSYAKMEEKIRELNWSFLTSKHPRRKSKIISSIPPEIPIESDFDLVEEIMIEPIIQADYPTIVEPQIVNVEYEPTGN